jgi:hypothetical protein
MESLADAFERAEAQGGHTEINTEINIDTHGK